MRTAKLICQESYGTFPRTLEIKNVGDGDALNIMLFLPYNIVLERQGLFPFPKLEAGRKIEVRYNQNPMLPEEEPIPARVILQFYYSDEGGYKEYTFHLTM